MRKKSTTGQRIICREVTSYKIHNLAILETDRRDKEKNYIWNYLENIINNSTISDSILRVLQSAKDNNGRSPLHYAAKFGLPYSCKSLIYHLKLELIKDDRGLTPLHYAARYGHFHVVKVFLNRINEKNVGFEGKFLFSI